jgi:uncharacterized membrane protein YfcA
MSGIPSEVWIAAVAFVAAFASGLAGFAFALVALGMFLHFRLPVDATPLVLAASLLAQCFSILALRDKIDWRRLAPFLVGGVAGVPLGVALLQGASPEPLKRAIGIFLVGYALFMLLRGQPRPVTFGGRPLDAAIGFVGGTMGGLGGLSGAIPTIWAGLRGWSKDEQRAVYQPYIFFMQAAALAWLWIQGGIGPTALADFVWCLPAVAAGVWLGLRLYARVNDAQFRKIVLALLLASGVVLVV